VSGKEDVSGARRSLFFLSLKINRFTTMLKNITNDWDLTKDIILIKLAKKISSQGELVLVAQKDRRKGM